MHRKSLFAFTALAATLAIAQEAVAQTTSKASSTTGKDTTVGEVVVTGVFSATSVEKAPIAIAAVTQAEIQQQVPVSSADLLKNVPGVFVNSGLGEIRNVVFSRGVSANSLDGSGGYFYVSLQEDGLPVEAVTASNYGPDYFSRPDIMLDRLEALRGGTATVTGPNAPGGIFNYISRTGRGSPALEVQGKFGLEGDGKNPYYRTDVFASGQLRDNLWGAIGGFYRHSDGARYPGYALNYGGQVRGNLLWEYDRGRVLLTAKYLDDHNAWFEFLPAFNFGDPKIAPGFTNESSVLPPANGHPFVNADGTTGSWDASNIVHAQSAAIGVNWNHDLSERLHLENKARFSDNRTYWNTGAAIFAVPLDDPFNYILTGSFGLPGTFTFKDRTTGTVVGRVFSASGFDHTVTLNNLPNQQVLKNGVFTEAALVSEYHAREFQDQFTLNADLGSHKVSVGGFLSLNHLSQHGGSGGLGLAGIGNRPQVYDITLLAPNGVTYQVTDPAGFAGEGRGAFDNGAYRGAQNQFSFFLGDTWTISDRLSADAGVRYENIRYDITNRTVIGFTGDPTKIGGADNNPLTLWDNGTNTIGPDTHTKRNFNFLTYTASIAYQVSDRFQAYVRYTNGRKAPDFGLIQTIDTPAEIATVFPKPQKIEQVEVGLKYFKSGLRLAAFPFYSHLSNVGSNQVFFDQNGVAYSPPPVFGEIQTYGVEFSGDANLTDTLALRAAITLQRPRQSGFSTYLQNTPSRTDDTLITIPAGDADNNPKIIVRTTATYTPTPDLQLFATYNYLGKRAANNFNAFYLPGFSTVDLGVSYKLGSHVKLQGNINNVFDGTGVMSWARSGGFLTSLDRQSLTKQDVATNPGQVFAIVPTQPRSFFITATYTF